MKKNELNSAGPETVFPLEGSELQPATSTIFSDPGEPYLLADTTSAASGDMSVSAGKTVATIPQLANYLVSGFWQAYGAMPHHWASNTISFNINGLNSAEQFLALSALQAWHEVANITFVQTSGAANITFSHAGTMTAVTNANWNGAGLMTSATVDISSDWITNDGGAYDGKTGIDSYGYQTYVHEIGHALGLGHQGPYNGSASYSTNAIYANDTWQYSIMSYFAEHNYSGSSYRYVVTPQMADIYAAASIYGAATATRPGDTVYGFNSNAGAIYDFTKYSQAPALTICDSGGINTLDCSGYSIAQTIDLHPGAFSSVGGLVNNVGIALNTTIKKAIAGSGNDTLIANDSGCTLVGGSGNDTMIGGAGNDWLIAGTGVDQLTGGGAADTFVFAAADSSAASGQHDLIADFASGDHIDLSAIDAISGTPAHDSFYFYGLSPFNNTAGQLNYYYNSGANVTVLQGDTNGDGIADFAIDLTGNIILSLADVIGAIAFSSATVESYGSTSLVEVGNTYYYLNPVAGGTGPEVILNGSPLVVGQFPDWSPVGAEKLSSGYQLVMKSTAGQFIIWTLDENGSYVTNTAAMTGTGTELKNYETSFQQDLNGDGVIGIPSGLPGGSSTTIEAFGVTSLVQTGNNYFLNPVAGGTGPEVMLNGSPIVVGQFSGWSPVGAEKLSSGYQLVMKSTAGQFIIWTLDNNGSYVTNTAAMTGTGTELKNYETSFQQDLNGDGVIGIPSGLPGGSSTTIEAFGVTSLVQTNNNYFLNPVAGGTGPEVMLNGSPLVVGQFPDWSPVGAEKLSSGYQLVMKSTAGQFIIWTLDNNGSYVTNTAAMTGTGTELKNYETSFQQDLNGDGVIGIPSGSSTTIEAFGVTSLVQTNNNYFLNPVAGGTGPEVMLNGSPLVVGQFPDWSPVGAEKLSSGYQLVMKSTAGQFIIWTLDNNGSYVTNTAAMTGTGTELKNYETSFQQDLNGDGVIGVSAAMSIANATNESLFFRSAPLASSAVVGTNEPDFIHVTSLDHLNQGAIVPVEQHWADLVGGLENLNAGDTSFHFIDPMDHFIIR